LKNFGKDYLKSITCKLKCWSTVHYLYDNFSFRSAIEYIRFALASPTIWKKFMRMKQNVLTVFHFFKALMKKVKQFKPRSYGQWRMIPQKISVSQKKKKLRPWLILFFLQHQTNQ
jgi:hypothetical protein